MKSRRVAFVSGAGGTGKTTTSLAVASIWAETHGACTLVDTNTGKNTGAATWWLDRVDADMTDGLDWARAKPSELAGIVKKMKGRVVVDTPPGFVEDEDPDSIKAPLADILKGVSAAVVLGAVLEFSEIDEAVATIRAHTNRPVAVAFTRTMTTTDQSAFGEAARQLFDARKVEILGSIRDSKPVQRTKVDRQLPTMAKRAPGAIEDMYQLAARLDAWLEEVA